MDRRSIPVNEINSLVNVINMTEIFSLDSQMFLYKTFLHFSIDLPILLLLMANCPLTD